MGTLRWSKTDPRDPRDPGLVAMADIPDGFYGIRAGMVRSGATVYPLWEVAISHVELDGQVRYRGAHASLDAAKDFAQHDYNTDYATKGIHGL